MDQKEELYEQVQLKKGSKAMKAEAYFIQLHLLVVAISIPVKPIHIIAAVSTILRHLLVQPEFAFNNSVQIHLQHTSASLSSITTIAFDFAN